MKKIGIVGGTAWRSTAEYYEALCERSDGAAEFAIESLELRRALSYLGNIGDDSSWERFDRYHRDALARVERSGAELAFFASNTPHHRIAQITHGVEIPVVSIVDAVASTCKRTGVDRLLVLGTNLTMRSPAIAAQYARHGIDARPPLEADRAHVEKLIERLQAGLDTTGGAEIRAIAQRAGYLDSAASAVALACTELPLAFPGRTREAHFEADGARYVNTLAAHVDAIFAAASAP